MYFGKVLQFVWETLQVCTGSPEVINKQIIFFFYEYNIH